MKKYLLIGLFLLGLFIYPIKAISGNTPEELYVCSAENLNNFPKPSAWAIIPSFNVFIFITLFF